MLWLYYLVVSSGCSYLDTECLICRCVVVFVCAMFANVLCTCLGCVIFVLSTYLHVSVCVIFVLSTCLYVIMCVIIFRVVSCSPFQIAISCFCNKLIDFRIIKRPSSKNKATRQNVIDTIVTTGRHLIKHPLISSSVIHVR